MSSIKEGEKAIGENNDETVPVLVCPLRMYTGRQEHICLFAQNNGCR